MVELKESKAGYEIKDLRCHLFPDRYELEWRYRKGNSFLIIVSSGKDDREFVRDIFPKIREEWESITEEEQLIFGDFRVSLLQESIFTKQNRKMLLYRGPDLQPPLKIWVLPCDIQAETKNVAVFRTKEPEGEIFVPLEVSLKIGYKKKLFFSKEKRCSFRLDNIEGYTDGSIGYRVQDDAPYIPLSSQCLGKTMHVMIPKTEILKFSAMYPFNKLYTIVEKTEKI